MKEYPFNSNYIIYKDGRIKSKRFNKFLTPKVNWDGYHRVQIWKDCKYKFKQWHRIIAETFIPNLENKPVVNHKNGIKSDNRVYNLEWCTQQENIIHAWKNNLSKVHSNYPLDMLTLDGEYIKSFESAMAAMRNTGISNTLISKACKYPEVTAVAGNYKWRYSETSND